MRKQLQQAQEAAAATEKEHKAALQASSICIDVSMHWCNDGSAAACGCLPGCVGRYLLPPAACMHLTQALPH